MFAASAGTPVVGLAYNPKFAGWFELLGCPDRVLDATSFVRGGLVDQLEAMLNAALGAGRLDLARLEALGGSLRAFNRGLLPPMTRPGSKAPHG